MIGCSATRAREFAFEFEFEFASVMAISKPALLRRVLAEHPTAPVVELRGLLSTYPMLGALDAVGITGDRAQAA